MNVPEALGNDPSALHELRHRLDGLNRLLEVAHKLAAEIDLAVILRIVTDDARRALNCDRASLYQYDPRRDELYTAVVTELEIAEIRHDLHHGITGQVARERRMANVSDPAGDPNWNPAVDRETGYQTQNILAAPLTSTHDGSLLGVLQLINKAGGCFDKFDEELLEAFSQHAAVALDRARLVEELRKRHATEASLEIARDIQRSFMPSTLPDIPGYEVATWWFPNEAVGGDYCDVIRLKDGRIALVIADVSGHGLGPALIMASVRAALRALILEHSAAEVLLGLLDRALAEDLQNGRFITMVLAGLDLDRHTVEYANAGHAPAMHFVASSGTFMNLESTGLPLGVSDRPDYPQGPPLRMEVGDILLLCTDGIVDAMDQHDQRFGQQRLEALVRSASRSSAADIVQQVGAAVEAYYAGDMPPDDLTVLALRRTV